MPATWELSLDVRSFSPYPSSCYLTNNVFPATLMRSNDPSKEFADMAGKALSVEWLVEHAPEVFKDVS